MIRLSLHADGRLTISTPDEWSHTHQNIPDLDDDQHIAFSFRGEDRFHVNLSEVFPAGLGTVNFNDHDQITWRSPVAPMEGPEGELHVLVKAAVDDRTVPLSNAMLLMGLTHEEQLIFLREAVVLNANELLRRIQAWEAARRK